jgi:hypothetical protein
MKRPSVFVALAGLAVGAFVGVRRARSRALNDEHLHALDDEFHATYGELRTTATHATPVLVLFGETLSLFAQGERRDFVATAQHTELLKASAHVPVGVYALLSAQREALAVNVIERQIRALQKARTEARAALSAPDDTTREVVDEILLNSERFLARTLAAGRVLTNEITLYAKEQGPLLLRVIDRATELELQAVHHATDQALATLEAEQRSQLEVVVAGVHQARARSLPLQYFQKRFGEKPGEEKRVTYAESAVDVEAARALIGTRKLDRLLAEAFFGDAQRLQRDVLGDSAAALLARSELSSLA